MTSSRLHAVLFTKDNCGPCIKTKRFLVTLLSGSPGLGDVISTMAIENHPALREAYGLTLFPTLLITDQSIKDGNDEVDRIVGGKLIRDQIESVLTELLQERNG